MRLLDCDAGSFMFHFPEGKQMNSFCPNYHRIFSTHSKIITQNCKINFQVVLYEEN